MRELTARRVRRLSALLQLAGPGAAVGRTLQPGARVDRRTVIRPPSWPRWRRPGADWRRPRTSSTIGSSSWRGRTRMIGRAGSRRPSCSNSALGPARQARDLADRAAWDWLGKHYRHESLDLHDLVDTDKFFETAAEEWPAPIGCRPGPGWSWDRPKNPRSCWPSRAGRIGPRSASDCSPAGPGRPNRRRSPWRSSSQTIRGSRSSVRLQIRAAAPIPPDGHHPRGLGRGGAGEVSALLPADWSSGLDCRVRRAYHLLVPLSISPQGTTPQLVLRGDPGSPETSPSIGFA